MGTSQGSKGALSLETIEQSGVTRKGLLLGAGLGGRLDGQEQG